ncbi:unnamed protein product, partial [Prorocentrum cordatum]
QPSAPAVATSLTAAFVVLSNNMKEAKQEVDSLNRTGNELIADLVATLKAAIAQTSDIQMTTVLTAGLAKVEVVQPPQQVASPADEARRTDAAWRDAEVKHDQAAKEVQRLRDQLVQAEAKEQLAARTLAQATIAKSQAAQALAKAEGVFIDPDNADGDGKGPKPLFHLSWDQELFTNIDQLECEQSEKEALAQLEKEPSAEQKASQAAADEQRVSKVQAEAERLSRAKFAALNANQQTREGKGKNGSTAGATIGNGVDNQPQPQDIAVERDEVHTRLYGDVLEAIDPQKTRGAQQEPEDPSVIWLQYLQCRRSESRSSTEQFLCAIRAMRQDPVPSLEICDGSAIPYHPKDIVDLKPDKWHRKWAPPISDPDEATKGSAAQVRRDMIECLVTTARMLKVQGLSVASKSVAMCTKLGLAKDIVRAPKLRGVAMTAAKHTSYLGVDQGAGVRHAREQRVKRSAKHLVRHRKVAKYVKTLRRTKITSRLERQGAQAAGRCLATLLELEANSLDPAQRFITGTFRQWLTNWRRHPEARPGIIRAWDKVRLRLEAMPHSQRRVQWSRTLLMRGRYSAMPPRMSWFDSRPWKFDWMHLCDPDCCSWNVMYFLFGKGYFERLLNVYVQERVRK